MTLALASPMGGTGFPRWTEAVNDTACIPVDEGITDARGRQIAPGVDT